MKYVPLEALFAVLEELLEAHIIDSNDPDFLFKIESIKEKESTKEKENNIYINNISLFKKEKNNILKKEKSFSLKNQTIKQVNTKFHKPTIDEVEKYMSEKSMANPRDTAEHFWDYNEARGWCVGRFPMKNWKSAVNTWCRNARQFALGGNSKEITTEPKHRVVF